MKLFDELQKFYFERHDLVNLKIPTLQKDSTRDYHL